LKFLKKSCIASLIRYNQSHQ